MYVSSKSIRLGRIPFIRAACARCTCTCTACGGSPPPLRLPPQSRGARHVGHVLHEWNLTQTDPLTTYVCMYVLTCVEGEGYKQYVQEFYVIVQSQTVKFSTSTLLLT